MKKFVLIPDSFKGTLSSMQVCQIMQAQIKRFYPQATVVSIPVADGGEGSVDCFLTALGGKKIDLSVTGPFFEKINSFYGMIDENTAVIEMSAAAGLPMVEDRKNPLKTTTYGVGELILDATLKGAKKIILGLGGSCTNDFGAGAACACGVQFFDENGKSFIPVGQTLKDVKRIDFSNLDDRLKGVEIITMCDIDNPPYGKDGAARVFAPQKGADEKAVELLDYGVTCMCNVIKKQTGVDLSNLSGGGAAGAMGAGMVAFFGAQLKMGIDTVLDLTGFERIIKDASVIFTGEGKLDQQSLRGKVVMGVARSAKKQSVPVISIVGGVEGDVDCAYSQGVTAVFSINKLPQDFSVSKKFSEENLSFTMQNVLRLLKI